MREGFCSGGNDPQRMGTGRKESGGIGGKEAKSELFVTITPIQSWVSTGLEDETGSAVRPKQ
jgi:hypothetical protein